jgi:recombination protein RecR
MYPKILEILIDELKKFPGVGNKTAERFAFDLLDRPDEEIVSLITSLQQAKDNLRPCSKCGNIASEELCPVCQNENRDRTTICVVSYPKDILAMEKMGTYFGLYHVLNGVISTFKGILPEDINIASLIERIDEEIKEVIIATNPTLEGETTAQYIARRLQDKDVAITRLASGLPMGGMLDYADELTLIKAMEGRKKIEI